MKLKQLVTTLAGIACISLADGVLADDHESTCKAVDQNLRMTSTKFMDVDGEVEKDLDLSRCVILQDVVASALDQGCSILEEKSVEGKHQAYEILSRCYGTHFDAMVKAKR